MDTIQYYFFKAEIGNGITNAPTRTQGIYTSSFREKPDESFAKLIEGIASDLKVERHKIDVTVFNFLCSI